MRMHFCPYVYMSANFAKFKSYLKNLIMGLEVDLKQTGSGLETDQNCTGSGPEGACLCNCFYCKQHQNHCLEQSLEIYAYVSEWLNFGEQKTQKLFVFLLINEMNVVFSHQKITRNKPSQKS